MTCGHCAKAVTIAVEAVPTVRRAVVDLDRGEVAVEAEDVRDQAVRAAIADAGYEVLERL
jgi:copper chaperone